MPDHQHPAQPYSRPRQRAEAFLHHSGQEIGAMPTQDIQRLVQELQIHQLELEMQNEELRRTQQALEVSRDRYSALYDFAPIGYLTLDHEGSILEANLPAAQMLGVDRSQLRHTRLTDWILPDAQDTFYLHRQQTVATQTRQTCTLHLQRQDGSTFFGRLDSLMASDEAGHLPQWRTALSDVTAPKKAEEVLQQRDWLEVTLSSIVDAVLTTDTSGAITLLNRAAEALTGWSAQEALGRSIQDICGFVHEHTRQVLENPVSRVLREDRRLDLVPETLLITRHGSAIPITGSSAPIRSGSGTLHGAMVAVRDITLHRQLEAQLRETHKMEAIGTLAGGVAHDFNNILQAIIGFTELVQDDVLPMSLAWENLQNVLTAGQRAKNLVQQILTFSHRNVPQRQPLRLSAIVEETLLLLRATLPSNIVLRPAYTTTADMVMADPTQIQQVLMNLGVNAMQAMQSTGGVLEMRLAGVEITPTNATAHPTLPCGPYLLLTVRDTGAGMSPEVMARIFEPFYTTKGLGGGTGMGLAVVHGIVASHEGAITVASELGRGTTFAMYLPRLGEVPPVPAGAADPLAPGQARILFVDDEALLANLCQVMLPSLGYTITTYTSPLDALAAFEAAPQSFDLVITDQTMPDMLGETLIRALRRIRSAIPVILCTGYNPLINAEAAAALEVDAFLMKPVGIATFAHTIQQVLARRRTQQG